MSLQKPQSSELEKYCSRPAKKATRQLREKYGALITTEYVSRGKRQLEEKLLLIRMTQQAGVELLTGTDLGPSLFVPGFSLHDELEHLVDAGLRPIDALRAATRNPARWLKQADLGTIEAGKLADMVLLDGNPLDDIRNTRKIQAVVARGKVFDRRALDAMLETAVRSSGDV